MANSIENLFLSFVFFFDLLILLLVFIFVSKIKNRKILWLIATYCILNSLSNLISVSGLLEVYDYEILLIFTVIEYLLFSTIIYSIISSKIFKKLILGLTIVFFIVVILHYETGKQQGLDSVPIGVSTIFILIYSFYYLYEEMNNVTTTFIYNRYTFWIVIGIMIYLGGSFFIYILANEAERSLLEQIWFLTYVFYIIKNIFFGIAIYMLAKTNKPPLNKNLRPSLN